MHFHKPDSPWLTKYDAEVSSIGFPARAVSEQPVRVLGTLCSLCGEEIQQGKGDGEQRGCASILQQSEAGGVQQSPSPSHHGWLALPGSILTGSC